MSGDGAYWFVGSASPARLSKSSDAGVTFTVLDSTRQTRGLGCSQTGQYVAAGAINGAIWISND
jgi:hypothetical protein